jgi:hypothetical protein
VTRSITTLDPREQLAKLEEAPDQRQVAIALSLAMRGRDRSDTVNRSVGWVLNAKAVVPEVLAQHALLARDRADPTTAPLVARIEQAQRAAATLDLATPAEGKEALRLEQLARLDARARELSQQLALATGRRVRDDPWVAPGEVRHALPGDAVLVEFARFDRCDFHAASSAERWMPPHYAAWVIPAAGQGPLQLIDLGESDPIETAVAQAWSGLQRGRETIAERGERAAEAELSAALETLAGRVLRPLLDSIGDTRRWVLSPDAALWLVPWAALPLAPGRYAVEDHAIQLVVSGRDLVRDNGRAASGRPVILADPDFDLDPASVRQTPPAWSSDASIMRAQPAAWRLSSAYTFGAGRRPARIATLAPALEPSLSELAGSAPRFHADRWALEGIVKQTRRPRVVLLDTPGFTVPDDRAWFWEEGNEWPERAAGKLPGAPGPGIDQSVPPDNPLLRCGLLFAGCNRAQDGDAGDGVLTGLEIVGLDLRGTELVLLGACGSGADVNNGDAAATLRQAFLLAGAQGVVASLWPTPDEDAAQLLARFFKGLTAGESKAEALRQAQLTLIEAHRARNGAAHPYFWAAATITGQDPDHR